MFAPSRRLSVVLTAAALVVSYAVAAVATSGPAAASGVVTVTIQGKGTVTGDGIACSEVAGSDCSESYSDTQECDPDLKPPCHDVQPEVTLTAAADRDGFTFVG